MPQIFRVAYNPDAGTYGTYEYDPVSQQFGQEMPIISPITDNWYASESRFFFGPGFGESVPWNPYGENYLMLNTNGDIQLSFERSASSINQGTSTNLEYGLTGTVQFTAADNTTQEMNLVFAKLGALGQRWGYGYDAEGSYHLRQIPANLSLGEAQAWLKGNGVDFTLTRWGTAQEVAAQAITGELFRLLRSQDPIDREWADNILNAMGITRDQLDMTGSDQVAQYLQANLESLTAASRYTFTAR